MFIVFNSQNFTIEKAEKIWLEISEHHRHNGYNAQIHLCYGEHDNQFLLLEKICKNEEDAYEFCKEVRKKLYISLKDYIDDYFVKMNTEIPIRIHPEKFKKDLENEIKTSAE